MACSVDKTVARPAPATDEHAHSALRGASNQSHQAALLAEISGASSSAALDALFERYSCGPEWTQPVAEAVLDRRLQLHKASAKRGSASSPRADLLGPSTSSSSDMLFDDPTDTFQVLYQKCRVGAEKEVRSLISENRSMVSLHNPRDGGKTLLHAAARKGYVNIVNLLLWLAGADIEAVDDSGQTALHAACKYGHVAVVKALLLAGANPLATTKAGKRPRDLTSLREVWTVLDDPSACKASSGESDTHRHRNRLSAPKNAALTRSSSDDSSNRSSDILGAASPEVRARWLSADGPALYRACEAQDLNEMRGILAAKPSLVNWKNPAADERTCLHLAADRGFPDVASGLLLAGAEPNSRNVFGWTPTHVAAMTGHTELLRLLLHAGARLEETDSDGRTCMHWAALHNHSDVVKALIAAGASRIPKTVSGATPRDYTDSQEIRSLLWI